MGTIRLDDFQMPARSRGRVMLVEHGLSRTDRDPNFSVLVALDPNSPTDGSSSGAVFQKSWKMVFHLAFPHCFGVLDAFAADAL